MAGLVIVVGILVIVLMCVSGYCKKENRMKESVYGAGPENPEDVIYQVDRNTLMREARDKTYY